MLISKFIHYLIFACFIGSNSAAQVSFNPLHSRDQDSLNQINPCPSSSPDAPKYNYNLLADEIILKIFEYLHEGHIPLRLVSKDFRRLYDNFIYRVSLSIFPGLTRFALSRRNSGGEPVKSLNYKLIPLAHVLYFDSKHLMAQLAFDPMTAINIKFDTIRLIVFLQTKCLNGCLKLANYALKLKVLRWSEVNNLLFFNNLAAIQTCWTLGTYTIALEMHKNDNAQFLDSLSCLLKAVKTRHHPLIKLMLESLRDRAHRFSHIVGNAELIIDELANKF